MTIVGDFDSATTLTFQDMLKALGGGYFQVRGAKDNQFVIWSPHGVLRDPTTAAGASQKPWYFPSLSEAGEYLFTNSIPRFFVDVS